MTNKALRIRIVYSDQVSQPDFISTSHGEYAARLLSTKNHVGNEFSSAMDVRVHNENDADQDLRRIKDNKR